jgi:hypothetical protein
MDRQVFKAQVSRFRVAASGPKALAMADGQTIAKLRLMLPPGWQKPKNLGRCQLV